MTINVTQDKTETNEEDEDISELPLPGPSTSNKSKVKKKISYSQKFRVDWLKDKQFKEWLEKRWNRSKNADSAYCKYCNEFLWNAKKSLERHKDRKIHITNEEKYRTINQEKLASALQNYVMKEDEVVDLEIRIASFIAGNNLSLSICDSLVKFLKTAFPENVTVRRMSMGKQKFSNIIRFGKSYILQPYKLKLLQSFKCLIIVIRCREIC